VPTIVRSAGLTRGELRQLGENVLCAVDLDRWELTAVNRSLAAHGECVDQLLDPSDRAAAQRTKRTDTSLRPRPAPTYICEWRALFVRGGHNIPAIPLRVGQCAQIMRTVKTHVGDGSRVAICRGY